MNWIKVSDRLPEKEVQVVVYTESINININIGSIVYEFHIDEVVPYWNLNTDIPEGYEWSIEMARSNEKYKVLYWMPIPEIPKESWQKLTDA